MKFKSSILFIISLVARLTTLTGFDLFVILNTERINGYCDNGTSIATHQLTVTGVQNTIQ